MTIFSGVGAPQSIAGSNGGKTYVFNSVTNTGNIVVAPINPTRRRITFVNPSTTVILYVSMTTAIDPILGTASSLIPTVASLGGTLPVYPGSYVTIDGDCQCQWQALAASGTNNPLTVLDSVS